MEPAWSWRGGRVMGALVMLALAVVAGIALDVWLIRWAMR